MGSKKKKKGGGRRSKGRASSKDHNSHDGDDNELLSEEITALCAIFQEDCKVDSGSPPQIIIKLRPYSKDMGYEDLDISALLLVRCLPGYPYKCPRLQITPEKGLTKGQADSLLSLLNDQALCSTTGSSSQLLQKDVAISSNKGSSSRGPFVYGFIDLFSGSGESWNWPVDMGKSRGIISAVQSLASDGQDIGYDFQQKKLEKNPKLLETEEQKEVVSPLPVAKLNNVKEESEDDSKSSSTADSSNFLADLVRNGINSEEEDTVHEETEDDDDDLESETWQSISSTSIGDNQASEVIGKDLMMVHLLRLACASKGPLTDALPQIITELYNLGMFSEWVRDLALKSSLTFKKTFDHAFHQHMVSSKVSEFWKPTSDLGGPSASLPNSRYLSDFEELQPLGHGGFGHVVLCKNKLDGRQYAVKKIRLKDKNLPVNDRILREVATLSRLQHQHVVRYYQAWFETGVANSFGDNACGSETATSSTFSKGVGLTDVPGQENKLESTYLYIQMEYCPRTLRQVFESYNHFDKELVWHLFRQIVEGLAHIHGQGIIHRDLTPNNIFLMLEMTLKLEILVLVDQDGGFPTDILGSSVDGTGQVGTYFYTAPEIEQGWPRIDEKAPSLESKAQVDMYSLGVVFFELWHPFGTAMERHIILSDLKLKGELPSEWVAEFPEQASLLRCLMSQSPSDRPSAMELLQNAFPPRMEYELLDNILRTMQTSEDTSVYGKVVDAIFDEEMLATKNHHQSAGRLRMVRHDTSSIQFADLDTELRDYVAEVSREVFKQHCAKHLEIVPMRLLDDCPKFSRSTVKLLTHGGDMLELCHELRLPFVSWIVANQKFSFKRYEISYVYRRAIGHSPPNRYLQGDFDIIGGASALTEAEVLKVMLFCLIPGYVSSSTMTVDLAVFLLVVMCCHVLALNALYFRLILDSFAGITAEHRQKVAELLSMMASLRPQSSERKLKWVVIRRQLLQELNLAEATVNRLQTVGLRFCGAVDQALPRLRGALPADKPTRKALDELSDLFSYLRIYLGKESHPGALTEGALLAVGGRYDYLLHQMWDHEYKTNPPGAVGTSLALETIIQHSPVDFKPIRNEATTSILVCSRGGGGLLIERMELVAELWEENIKAELVPIPDPSLTEQYEYASEHEIKCLVIITDMGVSQTGFVKVRHLDLKREKEVQREDLVRFLLNAIGTQFRNPSVWF
ncbi:hypothetical protein CXB51_026106 [Gossypium anomalum]|uniref:non-specific serine/threonine protein kinase n=1 Tax=Gossypium anomalum TaxID=47600 RepID=A0A8J5Y3V6_9ROSI|nr:hypothetical protein CXB51_026106 [Gossypium anomalum]